MVGLRRHAAGFNHRRLHGELLNETLFFGIDYARNANADWVQFYSTERPHSALGYQTTKDFFCKFTAIQNQQNRAKFKRRLWSQPNELRGVQHDLLFGSLMFDLQACYER